MPVKKKVVKKKATPKKKIAPKKKSPIKKTTTKKKVVRKKTSTRKVRKAPRKPDSKPASQVKKTVKKVAEEKVVQDKPIAPSKKKRKTNYLNNADLLKETILSKKQGQMTDKLAKMLMMLIAKYGKKGNFANYTYNDDMQAYAAMSLVKNWAAFNPEKSSNPFAFYTQCVKNSFIQYLNQERRQRDIRDEVLVSKGLNPSFTYTSAYEEQQRENAGHDEYNEDEKPKRPFSEFGFDNETEKEDLLGF